MLLLGLSFFQHKGIPAGYYLDLPVFEVYFFHCLFYFNGAYFFVARMVVVFDIERVNSKIMQVLDIFFAAQDSAPSIAKGSVDTVCICSYNFILILDTRDSSI